MEKIRRKRVNNSLDQLRSLLPQTVHIRKDMASLLEQTVEYINIMHTVLNEDKPACLNKVYQAYQLKTEEMESFRKSVKQMKKLQETSSSSRNPKGVGKSSLNLEGEPFPKQLCPNSYYDQFCNHNWQPHRRFDNFFQYPQNFSSNGDVNFFNQPTTKPMMYQCVRHPIHQQYGVGEIQPERKILPDLTTTAEEDDKSRTESTSSSQVTTDDASLSSQAANCDIEAAAIATGILHNDCSTQKPDESRALEKFFDPNKCSPMDNNNQPCGFFETWLPGGSLPSLNLSQPTYTTCQLGSTNNLFTSSATAVEEPHLHDYPATQ